MGLVSLVGLVGLVVGPGGFSGSCRSSGFSGSGWSCGS